jgi:hypothetical protein
VYSLKSVPATSASPPVFENGTASDDIRAIRIGLYLGFPHEFGGLFGRCGVDIKT